MTGLLPCDAPTPHRPHTWLYVDPATRLATTVLCDGETRPEPERRCCPDPLCPCDAKGSGWSTDRAGSAMNGGTL